MYMCTCNYKDIYMCYFCKPFVAVFYEFSNPLLVYLFLGLLLAC